MNRYIHLLIFGLVLISCSQKKQEQSLKLWYDEPAQHFEESLVLGNGKVGASVFGGVESDKIYLNDATLWSGEPVDPNMNPDAHEFVPKVREALANEDYKLADKLNRNIQGKILRVFCSIRYHVCQDETWGGAQKLPQGTGFRSCHRADNL